MPLRRHSDIATPNLPTSIVDFRGFDSSIILVQRGGIPMSKGNFPESWSQAMLVGTMLVWRLCVCRRAVASECASMKAYGKGIHPVCCLRFVSDWTQPLDILSTDSEFVCCYLSKQRCLGNPKVGTNLGQRILAMRTGCRAMLCHGAT